MDPQVPSRDHLSAGHYGHSSFCQSCFPSGKHFLTYPIGSQSHPDEVPFSSWPSTNSSTNPNGSHLRCEFDENTFS